MQEYLESRERPFCFIGGLSVIRWGEIRVTNDVDITLLCGFGNEPAITHEILKHYKSRVADPDNFAINNRVVLVTASNGTQIDISLSGLDFENELIKRASYFEFSPGIKLKTCSAEDLIIMKAFSNRDKDWNHLRADLRKNIFLLMI